MAHLETPGNPNSSPNRNPNTSLSVATEPLPDPPPFSSTMTSDNPSVFTTAVNTRNNLKRPREEDTAVDAEVETSTDVPAPKRRVKATHDVIYRIVVPSRQIGKVIGRVGHRIQKIRDDSKATIKIADAISVRKYVILIEFSFPLCFVIIFPVCFVIIFMYFLINWIQRLPVLGRGDDDLILTMKSSFFPLSIINSLRIELI